MIRDAGGLALLAATGWAVAGCAGGRDETAVVAMLDNSFAPAVVRVPVGSAVRFQNRGRSPHNAIAVDGSWSTEQAAGRAALSEGESAEITFERPGRYRFYCSFHATPDGLRGMVGVLVVGAAIGEEAPAAEAAPDRRAPAREPTGVVRRVPQDYASIQAAVDAAGPGDLVLVGPGVYREQVTVTTPSLVIRGTDRNAVILEGEFQRANGVEVLAADGVAVENMTARNYLLNGFYWTGVTGYRGSYLTAYNNGDYGIYAFDSTDGAFEYSYASGSPDAGFYIGQCYPCRAIVYRVVAEHNALGYSGTNAGGELYVVGSVWRRNMAGIVPNTLDSELLPPERETTIAANLVVDNNNREAPAKPLQYPAFGNGIVIAGGERNLVVRNRILDHSRHGILVTPNLDRNFWFAAENVVRDNVIAGSGRADLALAAPAGGGNCFAGNRAQSSTPPGLETVHGCRGLRLPLLGDPLTTARSLGYTVESRRGRFPRGAVEDQPVPPPQPPMPGGADAPVRPAHDVFETYAEIDVRELETIPFPPEAEALGLDGSAEVAVETLPVSGPGFWPLFFAFYAYLLPVALLAAWLALAFWDIARRDDLSRGGALGWIAAILLVPLVGVVAYYVAGRSPLPGWLRAAVVAGGAAAYLVIAALGFWLGG